MEGAGPRAHGGHSEPWITERLSGPGARSTEGTGARWSALEVVGRTEGSRLC